MEALGLLTLMRDHCGSDGRYTWGILKTAEYFGQDHRKVRKAYDELVREKQVETIQSGKDPKTGKNLLLIVRPWGKNPVARVPKDSSPVADLPLVPSPLEPSSGISTPHSVSTVPTVDRPVPIEGSDYKTVGGRGRFATGLQARLDEERSELKYWEGKPRGDAEKWAIKSREMAAACRQKITNLEAQLVVA